MPRSFLLRDSRLFLRSENTTRFSETSGRPKENPARGIRAVPANKSCISEIKLKSERSERRWWSVQHQRFGCPGRGAPGEACHRVKYKSEPLRATSGLFCRKKKVKRTLSTSSVAVKFLYGWRRREEKSKARGKKIFLASLGTVKTELALSKQGGFQAKQRDNSYLTKSPIRPHTCHRKPPSASSAVCRDTSKGAGTGALSLQRALHRRWESVPRVWPLDYGTGQNTKRK